MKKYTKKDLYIDIALGLEESNKQLLSSLNAMANIAQEEHAKNEKVSSWNTLYISIIILAWVGLSMPHTGIASLALFVCSVIVGLGIIGVIAIIVRSFFPQTEPWEENY